MMISRSSGSSTVVKNPFKAKQSNLWTQYIGMMVIVVVFDGIGNIILACSVRGRLRV